MIKSNHHKERVLVLSKAKQVSIFVEKIFDLYHINKFGFFSEFDEDTFEEYEIPLFPSDEIDNEIMERLCVKLGLSKIEILSLDEDIMYKYWNKYQFFKLYDLFLETWSWNSRYKEKLSPLESLFYMFENETCKISVEERFDYKSVEKRLIEQLKEMDIFLPGTFHPNASITNLTIETEVLFSFPQITEMIRSYIEMVEKAETFFFRALNGKLSTEEINEYNFLINVLQITDIVMPSVFLTYDNVCNYRQAYIEEGLNDFFSYAKVRSFVGTDELCPGVNPWRCKEFFDDMDLVRKLANIFPEIKEQMRKFAMRVKKFQCFFVWSDAEHIKTSPEEDEFDKLMGCCIPTEQRAKEPTIVYVDKTKEELYDWDSYIEKANQVILPYAKGGLSVRAIDINSLPPYSIKRIQRRMKLKTGGNVQ